MLRHIRVLLLLRMHRLGILLVVLLMELDMLLVLLLRLDMLLVQLRMHRLGMLLVLLLRLDMLVELIELRSSRHISLHGHHPYSKYCGV
jgi:hypothetical protein